jgi:hypothetical protein
MDVGDYISSALAVPQGDGTTAATWLVVWPDGSTDTGSGATEDEGLNFTAAIGPVPASGWGRLTWTVTGAGVGVQHSRFYVTPAPTGWAVWPPTVTDVKLDMARNQQVSVSDDDIAICLGAAIDWVTDRKGGTWDLSSSAESESGALTPPDQAIILGTVRLAIRWIIRRRSGDGMLSAGEQGNTRVASFDADIYRMLRIGRHAPMAFA